MNTIAQDKAEAAEMNRYRHVKQWAARCQQVMPKEELIKLLELGDDEFNAWFGGEMGGQGREVVARLSKKKQRMTLKIIELMTPIIKKHPALQKIVGEDQAVLTANTKRVEAAVAAANGGPAVKKTSQDPKVLWEDTKIYVDNI